MTLIRKSLYESLIKSRDEQLARIEAAKEKLKVTQEDLKVEQKFVDNFDKTQSDLAASIVQLETEISKLEVLLKSTSEEIELQV